MMQAWMIRSGDRGYQVHNFIDAKITAIGWWQAGDPRKYQNKDALVAALAEFFPEESRGNHLSSAGQLLRFANELAIGDRVVTYHADSRTYHWGEIETDHIYNRDLNAEFPNIRRVNWKGNTSRDSLQKSTKNTLGSTLTLFRLPIEVWDDIWMHGIDSKKTNNPDIPVANQALVLQEEISSRQEFADQQEKAINAIEDIASALSWEEMQELVASLLRAIGYKTTVSSKGADRGKDIFASPDGLGLQEPRIFVEVKHRKGAMGAPEIRTFIGGRKVGDKCLYVSTGGFTQEARYEAERSSIPVQLLTLRDLVGWILDYYEDIDGVGKELLPLRKLYWPLG